MNINDLFEKRHNYYLAPSTALRGAMILCAVISLVTIAAAVVFGHSTRLWGALLFNLFFFFSIALGGIAFSGMQDVVSAEWGRPIKRLHEGFSAFLPVGGALMLLLLVCLAFGIGGADKMYSWIVDPASIAHFRGKDFWLQKNFMVGRDALALVIILVLAHWQINLGLKRDKAFIAGQRDQAIELGVQARRKLQYWCAPVLVCYAFAFSLLAFDLVMSLAPTWFSTLFAAWMFAIMMQTLMASLLIAMFAVHNHPLGHLIGQSQFHDVGKLMHGFTIFFAYLTYAHVLTYWYGNIPEETEYYIHRLHAPWIYLVIGIPFLVFIIPFFTLIFKAAKWTSFITIPICVVILFAQWLVDLLVVMPQVVEGASWRFPWIEMGCFAGVLALFLASFFWFAKRNPMVGLADPLLAKSLSGGHH